MDSITENGAYRASVADYVERYFAHKVIIVGDGDPAQLGPTFNIH